jgi:hypothetical protein
MWTTKESQSDKRPEYQLSTARASRPTVVIRTILTLIILPPARNFSKDRVTRLRLTIPLIMAPLKPCAAKSDCVAPLRAAVVRKVSARCCSALRLMFNVEHGFAGAAGQQWPDFQYPGDRGPIEPYHLR